VTATRRVLWAVHPRCPREPSACGEKPLSDRETGISDGRAYVVCPNCRTPSFLDLNESLWDLNPTLACEVCLGFYDLSSFDFKDSGGAILIWGENLER